MLQVEKLAWPNLNANWARIYCKISRITLWAFDLRLGRGVSPNFQPQRVSLRLGWPVRMHCTFWNPLHFTLINSVTLHWSGKLNCHLLCFWFYLLQFFVGYSLLFQSPYIHPLYFILHVHITQKNEETWIKKIGSKALFNKVC